MEAERSDKLDAASRGSRENIGDRLPKLTILLVTYNHEKYIGQALDGLLIQEVPFSYDVVIADDAIFASDAHDIFPKFYAFSR